MRTVLIIVISVFILCLVAVGVLWNHAFQPISSENYYLERNEKELGIPMTEMSLPDVEIHKYTIGIHGDGDILNVYTLDEEVLEDLISAVKDHQYWIEVEDETQLITYTEDDKSGVILRNGEPWGRLSYRGFEGEYTPIPLVVDDGWLYYLNRDPDYHEMPYNITLAYLDVDNKLLFVYRYNM